MCLKEPDKSIYFVHENLKEQKEALAQGRVYFISNDEMSDFISRQVAFERELMNSIEQEVEFLPLPRVETTCDFCPKFLSCDRGYL